MRIPEKGVRYKATPKAFLFNYLIGMGLIALSLLVGSKLGLDPSGGLVPLLAFLAFWLPAAWLFSEPFVDGLLRHYLVSDSEVVKVEGVFRKARHAIPYQSVSEVTVSKNVLGMLLNYGTVQVEGARDSSSGITMRHVHNPDEVRRLIRHRVDSGGPAEKKPRGQPRGGQKEAPEDDEGYVRLE